ncbi:glutaconate CoA-transferase subunit A [Leucobacter exalbidus]|uniref:Glutaconate CoA-transferase subunit A n=1 Tax=Leucobacter exalbidus TaxID=662960 RepID=A0A940PSH5_9MICO|nr:CoA transferase subunit A [Leucobacter exalbidus]MBP1325963.1 glutaconate CoA-transferase subunit A [Leucobacter exalbidus]
MKQLTLDGVVSQLSDGMTIGIGGWGSRRKPMALLSAVVRSGVRDLTVVSFGGPDVGVLCATGQATKVVHAFVSLDTIAVDPHFAAAREQQRVDTEELDEAMLVAGLRAAGRNLPFEATRAGLDSDAVTRNPRLRTITSPYDDGDVLLAMPAIHLDLALLHLHRADARGNAQLLGLSPYFDDLLARAAKRVIVSAEEIVPTAELTRDKPVQSLLLNRTEVTYVVEAPGGAGFTSCEPSYPRDEARQRDYVAAATSPEAFNTWQRTNWHEAGARS